MFLYQNNTNPSRIRAIFPNFIKFNSKQNLSNLQQALFANEREGKMLAPDWIILKFSVQKGCT